MQTPLPKKRAHSKSVEFLSPSFCASELCIHGAEKRDPKRRHQDYFRNGMATTERKEGLTKRLEDMTSELGTRDAHFLQRLGQLHITSINAHEKVITELADEMVAMDLVAGQLDQQAHEIDVLNQQLQLARSTLEKNGCVCVAFLLCVVPARFPSPRLTPRPPSPVGVLTQIQSAGDACYLDTRGTARLKKTYYRHCNQLDTALEGIFTKKVKREQHSMVEARKLWLIRRLAEKHAPQLLQQASAPCTAVAHPNRAVTQTALRGRHLFSVLSVACDLLHKHQSPSSTAPAAAATAAHRVHGWQLQRVPVLKGRR
jgi:hypothetical protein